ncbi:MAG: hypothetical protein H6736_16095 [Alphaproteobacteria bacterium]|nr:hypothetical protein [Alphaproteobacteria bacterium]
MSNAFNDTGSRIAAIATVALVLATGIGVFASDYYEVGSDSAIDEAYGLESTPQVTLGENSTIEDATVVRRVTPDVLVARTDDDAVVVVLEHPPAIGDPPVGARIEVEGRRTALDADLLARHGVHDEAGLPRTMVVAREIELKGGAR